MILEKNIIAHIRDNCIHCRRCTKSCAFLEKYQLDLDAFTRREDLRRSCFMCDRCKEVCPKDLSGRELALYFRKKHPKDAEGAIRAKKKDPFRNRPRKTNGDMLFLGCNYPAVYPKTCDRLIRLAAAHGVGYAVDCCRKPILDAGGDPEERSLETEYRHLGVRRVICACPNCFRTLRYFFKEIEVITVYHFLQEIGWDASVGEGIAVYIPCADRGNMAMFETLSAFVDNPRFPFRKVNCCGLGGGARKEEPEAAEAFRETLRSLVKGPFYTYCASCASVFRRIPGLEVRNMLSEILDVHEAPAARYLWHRLRYALHHHPSIETVDRMEK